MKKVLFAISIIIIALAIVFYTKPYGHVAYIKDVTQKQIITLIERDKPEKVHGISILITGYIDGTATIQRAYKDKKMYEPSTISGKVDLRLGGDWYSDKCLIIYEPSNVKSGRLQIRYDFNR